MKRPVLKTGNYVLENHRGEKTERLNPGTEGVLYCGDTTLHPDLYIRG